METLPYHNYLNMEERQSSFDPDATVYEVTSMVCPRCKTEQTPLEHGESRTCGRCGLYMRLHGNALECR